MIAFHDRKGRLWCGRLDVAAALRMRDLAGTDVMELAINRDAVLEMAANPSQLANAAFALFLPQCERRGITDREFGKSLRGRMWGWWASPVLIAEMLVEEIGAFFDVPDLLPAKVKEGRSQRLTANDMWGKVYQFAAIAGVSPDDRTFGELLALADARRKHDWAQTACVLATIQNFAGMGRRTAISPADLDPTGGLAGQKPEFKVKGRDGIRALGMIFCGRG